LFRISLAVIFLGGIAWIGSHDLDPAKPLLSPDPPFNIQVVLMDWKWLFIYPKLGIASEQTQGSHRCAAAPLPDLGDRVERLLDPAARHHDLLPERHRRHLYLGVSHRGVYRGESAMINGNGFPQMHFNTHAVSRDRFDAWVAATRGRRRFGAR
jgi:cytochrome o ubiquinol oxidase subunit 2